MSTVIVRLNVRPEKEEEFLKIFSEVAVKVSAHEPDCRVYAAWKMDTPFQYCHIVSYRNKMGKERHTELHKDAVGDSFLSCLATDPEVEILDDVVVDAHKYYE